MANCVRAEHEHHGVCASDQRLDALPPFLECVDVGAVDKRLEAPHLQCCFQPVGTLQSKPGVDPSSGTSLGDALRLPKRHPACRRREAQSGSGTERENLAGDVKGKGASGSNREAESTDATERGGLPCSSVEAGVMLVERRRWVVAVGSEPTGNRRSSILAGRQPSCGGTSRMTRECQVRICEWLGVKFPGPTRHSAPGQR